MMKKLIIISLMLPLFYSCKKQDEWLNIKSNKSDVTPTTLRDFQALLDNHDVLNFTAPTLGIIGADNFYVTYSSWQSTTTDQQRNAYIWDAEIYNGETGFDWRNLYQQVEYANIVLEGIGKLKPAPPEVEAYKNAKGQALFIRANAFFNLAQQFAKPYTAGNAVTELGIPLRTDADVNVPSVRASLTETYEKILNDLKEAAGILPVTPLYKTRPSKPACHGLIARVYLSMSDFSNALKHADTSLNNFNTLIDYNTLSTTTANPFPTLQNDNKEVIFHTYSSSSGILFSSSSLKVDTLLYDSYHANDLRRTLLYRLVSPGVIAFKGDYTGSNLPSKFSGIATNEIHLIAAECNARLGKVPEAITRLNTLLLKRWKTGTFIPYTAADSTEALNKILEERRKELPFTGILRWIDLRRLNMEVRYAKTLTRNLNGNIYSLLPNDKRYVYPIPDDEIRLSGIVQNIR